MVTDLPAHTRERIDEIRTFHRPARRSLWQKLLRRLPRCTMCGTPWRCEQAWWADRVAAGYLPPAGWKPDPTIPRPRRPMEWRDL